MFVANSDQSDLSEPIYLQVARVLRERIAAGQWPENFQLPSEPELARELGISRGTLRRSLEILLKEKLITKTHGRGTFVSPSPLPGALVSQMRTLAEELAVHGIEFQTKTISAEAVPAGVKIAKKLQVETEDLVFSLCRIRFDEQSPIAVIHNYISLTHVLQEQLANLGEQPLFSLLEEQLGLTITNGQRTIGAVNADVFLAKQLDVAVGQALLTINQTSFLASGEPIEFSQVWLNPQRMEISTLVQR